MEVKSIQTSLKPRAHTSAKVTPTPVVNTSATATPTTVSKEKSGASQGKWAKKLSKKERRNQRRAKETLKKKATATSVKARKEQCHPAGAKNPRPKKHRSETT